MKLNRFVMLAVIALLLVGATAVVGPRTFAQAPTPAPTVQTTCRPDEDNIQEGDQAGVDTPDEGNIQEGDQAGVDTPDEEEPACGEKAGNEQESLPAGTPAITAQAAQQAAEAYLNAGPATKVEIDDQNGALVYSVEFGSGADVKVDAMTGAVLGAETDQD